MIENFNSNVWLGQVGFYSTGNNVWVEQFPHSLMWSKTDILTIL